MSKLQDQVNFLIEIDKVKGILRQSVILGDRAHRENDAEHSWHMALCALILGEYVELPPVNMETVLKMILIHDVIEIYAGDVPAYSDFSPEEKEKNEEAAAEKVFSLLPSEQKEEYLRLWTDFERTESNEAKYANVFDRFQGFLQNVTSDGHTWRKFTPHREMILRRMGPVIQYAPRLFHEIIEPLMQKYIALNIIR
ncbi:MAG: HD domain-containing protein [Fusobacteriaceae bacterium]|jgi:putative hydrolase of HD superfamily|nr:HD domain-containing protein [Fusobacteriaceae bacterium]